MYFGIWYLYKFLSLFLILVFPLGQPSSEDGFSPVRSGDHHGLRGREFQAGSAYYQDGGGKHDLQGPCLSGKAATPLAGQGLKILVILRSMFSCFFPFSDPIHGYQLPSSPRNAWHVHPCMKHNFSLLFATQIPKRAAQEALFHKIKALDTTPSNERCFR